ARKHEREKNVAEAGKAAAAAHRGGTLEFRAELPERRRDHARGVRQVSGHVGDSQNPQCTVEHNRRRPWRTTSRDYEVCAFVDANEALERISSDPDIDALITSAEMRSMSGIELCWQTRLLAGHYRQLYIVMMSS